MACDELAKSEQKFSSGKSAYQGGVYHVLQDDGAPPVETTTS